MSSFAALHTDDALALPPHAKIARGKHALQEVFQGMLDSGATLKSVQVVDVGSDGDLAYFTAAYAIDVPQEDGLIVSDEGKIVDILRRQPDGSWKFQVTIWNSDTPLPGQ